MAAAYMRESMLQEAGLQQQFVQLNLTPEQQAQMQQLLHSVHLAAAQHMQAAHELQQQDEEQEEEDEQDADPAAAAAFLQKAEQLRRERHQQLYPGSELNALAGMCLLWDWRWRHTVKDGAFDELLQMLHTSLLPSRNRMPNSLYLMRKILNIKRPADYDHHACACGKHYWKPRPRKDWSLSCDPVCPHCNQNRFVNQPISGGRHKLRPSGKVRR
jgi:hypothetical protein